ncbi:mCG144961, isoform CRA_b, partial [Mus musculus]
YYSAVAVCPGDPAALDQQHWPYLCFPTVHRCYKFWDEPTLMDLVVAELVSTLTLPYEVHQDKPSSTAPARPPNVHHQEAGPHSEHEFAGGEDCMTHIKVGEEEEQEGNGRGLQMKMLNSQFFLHHACLDAVMLLP